MLSKQTSFPAQILDRCQEAQANDCFHPKSILNLRISTFTFTLDEETTDEAFLCIEKLQCNLYSTFTARLTIHYCFEQH